jgi:hypothetical protein
MAAPSKPIIPSPQSDRQPNAHRFRVSIPPGYAETLRAFTVALNEFRHKKGSRPRAVKQVAFDQSDGWSSFSLACAVLTSLLKLSEPTAIRLLRHARRTFHKRAVGRPKGPSLPEFPSLFMAAARDCAGMSKREILRTVGRQARESDIRWLQRRLKQGRRLARDLPWSEFFKDVRSLPRKQRLQYLTSAIRLYEETDQPDRS